MSLKENRKFLKIRKKGYNNAKRTRSINCIYIRLFNRQINYTITDRQKTKQAKQTGNELL